MTIYLTVFTNCGNLTKYSQLYDYSDKNIFSKYQCDCCKGFSTHHILLVMIEKMKTARDKKRILRGYSHRFIVYFFNFLCFYFIINFMVWFAGFLFSGYLDIINGVPQGTIIGPLLFNIFVVWFFRTIVLI